MAKDDEQSRSLEEDRFRAHLKWAREEVRKWPEWKRDLLGWHLSKKKANQHGEQSDEERGDQKTGNAV